MTRPDLSQILGLSAKGLMREELEANTAIMERIAEELQYVPAIAGMLTEDQRRHVARAALLTIVEMCPAWLRFALASFLEDRISKVAADDPIAGSGRVVHDELTEVLNRAIVTLDGRMPPPRNG